MLDIPLPDPPRQDTLQNTLSGWCAHYGHFHASVQLYLFDLSWRVFNRQDKALMCVNCNMFPVDAATCLICGMAVCL